MEKYYEINNSDGDTYVQEMSKEQMEEKLNKDLEDLRYPNEYFTEMPECMDTNYWEGKRLIIKGVIVTPKAVEKVTKLTLE